MRKVFIHTNDKQLWGAYLAKYSFERMQKNQRNIPVEIINVNALDIFKDFAGKTYKRGSRTITYTLEDLQSFTLARFMPPKLMAFEGQAVVIDPDIFSLVDVAELFDLDVESRAIACCRKKKKNIWDTSLMLLDCAQLRHWDIKKFLHNLSQEEVKYEVLMRIEKEQSVYEIPRAWNSLDILDGKTKILHTTERLTQPWKTGLPIDYTIKPMPKILGIIPREPIHKMLGTYPTVYQPHRDKDIESFFFTLVRDALRVGVITEEFTKDEIKKGNVRPDILARIEKIS